MKKFKTLLITLSALTLFACNGGGGSSNGGGYNPDPTPPTPPDAPVQPLTITQLTPISLNKTAGHNIWYMKITNPNDTAVSLYGFDFDTGSNTPVNPTKYALKYSNSDLPAESAGVVDCLGLISSISGGTLDIKSIPAGKQCIFKFDAQWDINTSSTKTYPFKMKYKMYSGIDTYIESSVCTAKPAYPDFNIGATVCLPNNQSMSFSINTVSQQADDLVYNNSVINPTGDKMFRYNGSGVMENYLINYNSVSNSYTPSLNFSYNTVNYNPLIYGSDVTNQLGDKAFISQSANDVIVSPIELKWILGLNGEMYGTPITQNTGTNKVYKYDAVNNNVIAVTSIPDGELLQGVSANGNFFIYSKTNGNICRNLTNYSNFTPLNKNGIAIAKSGNDNANYNGVFRVSGWNNYYHITNVKYDDFDATINNKYSVDIDTCTLDKDNYLTELDSLNTQFGIVKSIFNTNNHAYIQRLSDFSNGTDGQ